jgi:uncharacterized protein (TIGR02594 family)
MMNDLLLFMLRYYGIREVIGDKNNPAIIEMFHEIGYTLIESEDVAWCSAALNYFCKLCGYERSGLLNARSWLKVGTPITEPEIGDIVVFWRGTIDGWAGHVGMFIAKDKDSVFTLGGNQGDGFNISPYPVEKVLDYRRLSKIDNIN